MLKVLIFGIGLSALCFVVIQSQFGGPGGPGGQQQAYLLDDYLRVQNAYNLVNLQNSRVDPDRFNFVSEIFAGLLYFMMRAYQRNYTTAMIAG